MHRERFRSAAARVVLLFVPCVLRHGFVHITGLARHDAGERQSEAGREEKSEMERTVTADTNTSHSFERFIREVLPDLSYFVPVRAFSRSHSNHRSLVSF